MPIFLYEHNRFNTALPWYEEALKIVRTLAKANPEAYLPYVAMAAVNMSSIFFLQSQPDKEKSLAYAREVVQAAQPLMESVPAVRNHVALALKVAESWGLEPAAFWEEVIQDCARQKGVSDKEDEFGETPHQG